MTEAIRFYWRGRDASIPLAEIPEQDRTPLRVRRSVVQKYTPSVVQQLEEDRFVAAAWESGGQIHLVLCHPDLAKGSADTMVVNIQRLPGLVLRLTNWDRLRRLLSFFCERLAPRRLMSMNAWRQGANLWVGLQQTGSRR